MKALTSAARKSVLDRLKLADVHDVVRIRLIDDLIEQLRQVGRLSLRITKKFAARVAADPNSSNGRGS
jgi:hypothetical protein